MMKHWIEMLRCTRTLPTIFLKKNVDSEFIVKIKAVLVMALGCIAFHFNVNCPHAARVEIQKQVSHTYAAIHTVHTYVYNYQQAITIHSRYGRWTFDFLVYFSHRFFSRRSTILRSLNNNVRSSGLSVRLSPRESAVSFTWLLKADGRSFLSVPPSSSVPSSVPLWILMPVCPDCRWRSSWSLGSLLRPLDEDTGSVWSPRSRTKVATGGRDRECKRGR